MFDKEIIGRRLSLMPKICFTILLTLTFTLTIFAWYQKPQDTGQ